MDKKKFLDTFDEFMKHDFHRYCRGYSSDPNTRCTRVVKIREDDYNLDHEFLPDGFDPVQPHIVVVLPIPRPSDDDVSPELFTESFLSLIDGAV